MSEIVLQGRITGATVEETRISKAKGTEYSYSDVSAFVEDIGKLKFSFSNIQKDVAGKAKKLVGSTCSLVCAIDSDKYGSPVLVLTDVSE